eukprot:jgi/Botrbrau1/5247/Bobra.0172s0109.1
MGTLIGDLLQRVQHRHAHGDGHDEEQGEDKGHGIDHGVARVADFIAKAARMRADAVLAFVTVFGLGLLVVLGLITWESWQWRRTLTTESLAWRTFLKDEVHAMGFAAAQKPGFNSGLRLP